jgi:hypothetical protein
MIGEKVLEQLSVHQRASEQQSPTFFEQFISGARDLLAAYDGTRSTTNGAPSIQRSRTTTTTTTTAPSPPQEERVVQQQAPLNRVQNSTSIPELKRNYQSDVNGTELKEKLVLLASGVGLNDVAQRKIIKNTRNLMGVNKHHAIHNYTNLFEALQQCDEAKFGARLLHRAQVEARQTTGRVSDVINPKIVRNELRRVAKALNERVRSESFDNDEARKSFLLRALGDEWPLQ